RPPASTTAVTAPTTTTCTPPWRPAATGDLGSAAAERVVARLAHLAAVDREPAHRPQHPPRPTRPETSSRLRRIPPRLRHSCQIEPGSAVHEQSPQIVIEIGRAHV